MCVVVLQVMHGSKKLLEVCLSIQKVSVVFASYFEGETCFDKSLWSSSQTQNNKSAALNLGSSCLVHFVTKIHDIYYVVTYYMSIIEIHEEHNWAQLDNGAF